MNAPTAIGRYQVRERLGQGGMGTLFLALDPAIDRLVALKVLRVDDPDVRERFEREARFAARLQHPNIVTIYDVGEHEGQPFIAMEYIPGDTLDMVIRRRAPIDLRRKLEMLVDVCAGLAYAHKHGIVHRDVKPANLIVSRDSQTVKILDFGIARAGESGLTQVGMVIGTPHYMSPEQVRGELVDHRSDIFAVGLVLYELLVYRRAFEADSQTAVLLKILNEAPPDLLTLDPGLDPAVTAIVERTLAKDPAQRPPDLGALRTDLTRLIYRLETTGPDDRTMIVPRPLPRTGSAGATGTPERSATGAPPSARRPAPEVETLVREARARIAAGALTEASKLLRQAAQIDPQAPSIASAREALEQVLAERERHEDRARRVAAAVAHGRQALEAGSIDSAIRAMLEALSLSPNDSGALALRVEIEKRAPPAPAILTPVSVTPPPPPPVPPAGPAVHPPAPGMPAAPSRASARLPLAFLALAAAIVLLLGLGAVMIWRQFSPPPMPPPTRAETAPGRSAPPPAAPSSPAVENPPTATGPPPRVPDEPPEPRISATDPAALVTARLTEAVREFDDGSTSAALDHLAALIEEAPARADLRDTAERWARVLRRRAHEARDAVPKPRRVTWPAPLRAANQLLRIGDAQLQNGEMIAAARSFEKGRAAWARLADVVAARRDGRVGAQASRIDPAPTPGAREDAAAAVPPTVAAPDVPAPPPPGTREPAKASEPAVDDAVRAGINRTLAAFEQAFDSRSADSLRPIWPSLSSGALQSYRSQFSRTLFQQWTYTARDIRVGPNGNRAIAECTVTVSIQEAGSRETRSETRHVRFELERLGPLWVIAGVSGV